jgi:glycine/D-amino acid oxidase-like deaminating enzyme
VATELARASASIYKELHLDGQAAFDRVGGLEVASTTTAMTNLQRRAILAEAAGLPARVLDAASTVALAPELINPDRCVGGVLYPADGTARADIITNVLKAKAQMAGAQFHFNTTVTGIEIVGGDAVSSVVAGGIVYPADDIVIACGIWGPSVAMLAGLELPLTPVAHPYVYGPASRATSSRRPFVRWPEHHVYARHHGNRLGLGTYDHKPLEVSATHLGDTAEEPWPGDLFDSAVGRAMNLLPPDHRFIPHQQLNGIFAMTADNLPLVGAVGDVRGLWAAEALWVTHAAGAARALAHLITGQPPTLPDFQALDPRRFVSQSTRDLTDRALRLYRDIYTSA